MLEPVARAVNATGHGRMGRALRATGRPIVFSL